MKFSSPTLVVRLTQHVPAVVLWLALAILTPPPCSAQVKGTVELSSMVGIYRPSAQSFTTPSIFLCPKGALCPNVSAQDHPHSAIVFGGRVTGWISERVALEGSMSYSHGFVSTPTTPARASIVTTDVRVLVSTRGTRTWAYLAGGPAMVGRFGDAFTTSTGRGGVVGVGAHLRVVRSLALRAEVEDYLYSLDGNPQQDVSLSLGLSFTSRIGSAETPRAEGTRE